MNSSSVFEPYRGKLLLLTSAAREGLDQPQHPRQQSWLFAWDFNSPKPLKNVDAEGPNTSPLFGATRRRSLYLFSADAIALSSSPLE